MRKIIQCLSIASILVGASTFAASAPKIDTSNDRAKTSLDMPYQKLGVLVPKDVSKTHNTITLGCETLDRDYADYDAYKNYLAPLGIKKIRLQGGWAKTEKTKGKYDFAWLDNIINDATARGLTIWLETSYGNPIYVGGGTPFLAGGMPKSFEARQAWDNWVSAMVLRYKGKVAEYEIWNEPDLIKRPVDETVELNVRTAQIIRKLDPNAKIAGLALCDLNAKRFEAHVAELAAQNKLELFDWISYHGYEYRPEDSYAKVDKMREILKKYSKKLILRQGENGAPSQGYMGGALEKHPWTELTQAKWDLRRMLGDWGRGIDTSVFSISNMRYGKSDSIKVLNVKGLLETDENNKVVHIKLAYYAVQNLASVFDLLSKRLPADSFKTTSPLSVAAFGYADKKGDTNSWTIWYDEVRPTNFNRPTPIDVQLRTAKMTAPVAVDILSGSVYEIPASDISRNGDTIKIKNLPIYDSPMLITDKSAVDFKN